MVLALFIDFFLVGVRPAHADDSNVRTSLSYDGGPDFRMDPTNHREARFRLEGEWYFNVVGIEPKLLGFFEVDPPVWVVPGAGGFFRAEFESHPEKDSRFSGSLKFFLYTFYGFHSSEKIGRKIASI